MADTSTDTVVATIPQTAASAPPVTYAITLKQPPPADPHWTAYLTAISTPIVAILAALIAGGIAYKNWRTAQMKLKLDLFDKRISVVEAITRIRNSVRDFDEDEPSPVLGKLTTDMHETMAKAKYLFNPAIAKETNALYHQVFEYVVVCFRYVHAKNNKETVDFSELKDAISDKRDKVMNMVHELTPKFAEQIRIDHN